MYGVLPVSGDPEPTQIMLLDLKTRAVTQVAGSDIYALDWKLP
jgi:hypothetical protein